MKASLPLEEFLPYRLVRASELVSRRFAARYHAAYGISRPEWRTFAILGQLGHTTATEIGRRSTMHKTKVSRAVAALEKRGWLSRRADGADRRIEHLELTASGAAVYAELAAMARDFQAALREEIGREAAAALEAGLAAVEARFVSLEAADDD
ncbi:MarR family winged helix-turn-helix transcriptional regulator [Stappia sp.]|jgi:DNA-binding MarR family transcriptional regulator|uniref:MarR family winged helix-turn-helix transcriptional regulator n=1 Tax=Stappia sp. TaxID=1870903 RepID=UPI003D0BBC89